MGAVSHGYSRTPTYNCWANMIGRCTNANRPDFKNYGGRGIAVCQRWKQFFYFLLDMGEKTHGQSLDRIDVDGDYAPENCRWVDALDQNHNRRDTLWVVLGGEAMSAKRAAQRLNKPYERVRWAVQRYGDEWLAYVGSATAGMRQSNNTTGHVGVTWHKASGRFHAYLHRNGVKHNLGYFDSLDDAVSARVRAAAEIGKGMP